MCLPLKGRFSSGIGGNRAQVACEWDLAFAGVTGGDAKIAQAFVCGFRRPARERILSSILRRCLYSHAMLQSFIPGRKRGVGMSARLLLLAVAFVMLGEVLIYVPSIARFRKTYLEEHIARAHLATLTLADAPATAFGLALEERLLRNVDAHGVALIRNDTRVLALEGGMPPHADVGFDLRNVTWAAWIADAFDTLSQSDNRVLRVVGEVPNEPGIAVEVVMDERPMRVAMLSYSARILQLSIVISLLTAILLYLSLQWLLVQPVRRIIDSMVAFRKDPESETATEGLASCRSDEIGLAQQELAIMQREVRASLRQKSRLATLGAAVAKINHDLRNSLATAMLVSDSLANIDDPQVKQVLPRLYAAVDRAVDLCSQTLDYARDPAAAMKPTRLFLHDLIAEAQADLQGSELGGRTVALECINEVDPGLEIEADRGQFFRVFRNLGRNAFEAGATRCGVSARLSGERVMIEIADNGPGLPEQARRHLFQPFAASSRQGGTGLGLAIAYEIVAAHGGELRVTATGEPGTTFCLDMPLHQRRR
jgi:signal transduction histidine kinase